VVDLVSTPTISGLLLTISRVSGLKRCLCLFVGYGRLESRNLDRCFRERVGVCMERFVAEWEDGWVKESNRMVLLWSRLIV
jgi:hypothetical protein